MQEADASLPPDEGGPALGFSTQNASQHNWSDAMDEESSNGSTFRGFDFKEDREIVSVAASAEHSARVRANEDSGPSYQVLPLKLPVIDRSITREFLYDLAVKESRKRGGSRMEEEDDTETAAKNDVVISSKMAKTKDVQISYRNGNGKVNGNKDIDNTDRLNSKVNNVADKVKSVTDGNIVDGFSGPASKESALFKRRYEKDDLSPFIIQLSAVDEARDVHPLRICKLAAQICYSDIKCCKRGGKNRVLVECRSFIAANKLLKEGYWEGRGLRASIPGYLTSRSGIIRDIPVDLDLSTIDKNYIESSVDIIEYHRLNRRVRVEGQFQFVPSRTVCVKFKGHSLPKFVSIFKVLHSVEPYIPRVKICYDCFRVGHVGKNCRGRPRCIYCGGDRHPDDEVCDLKEGPRKCINCGGPHLPVAQSCIAITQHKRVQVLAAAENISTYEAKCRLGLQNGRRRGDGSMLDFSAFPMPRYGGSGSSFGGMPDHGSTVLGGNRFSALGPDSGPESLSYAQIVRKPVESQAKNRYNNNNSSYRSTRSVNNFSPESSSSGGVESSSFAKNSSKSVSQLAFEEAIKKCLLYPNGRSRGVTNGAGFGGDSSQRLFSSDSTNSEMAGNYTREHAGLQGTSNTGIEGIFRLFGEFLQLMGMWDSGRPFPANYGIGSGNQRYNYSGRSNLQEEYDQGHLPPNTVFNTQTNNVGSLVE